MIGVRILASLVRRHVGLAIVLGIRLGTRVDDLDYDRVPNATNGPSARNSSLVGHFVALSTIGFRTGGACAVNWTLPVAV